ncbi:MAG: Ferredoxin [Candidatus Berkelbacteria bacterium Licking1014_7]|uniref:Ferredoxin n=1 Tax=Candidatus Berkelbacteria bacterium Licking1014_7 TaxID=2017147 RepID=A0A554LJB8_9BACT|nr:MAG: Ferredoxin [Candidatus Berkelbacteria bacterium Licking1014_7]
MYKIKIDREKCISAASCLIFASKTFKLDDVGKAVVIDNQGNSEADILQAAKSCPVDAIALYDGNGKKVYPR